MLSDQPSEDELLILRATCRLTGEHSPSAHAPVGTAIGQTTLFYCVMCQLWYVSSKARNFSWQLAQRIQNQNIQGILNQTWPPELEPKE